MCRDGYVYDLTLEDNHNYFAENILVHNCGAYPKPSKRVKQLKKIVKNDLLLMSGTPHPESWSQIFHQFFISPRTPFDYKNFYQWANGGFVTITQKRIGMYFRNDYSQGDKEMIDKYTKKYFVTFTQKEAGFTSSVEEKIIEVEMKPQTYKIAKKLEKDKVVQGKSGIILADTPVKMLNKIHQIYSGTCKLEDNISITLDTSKAEVIKEKFKGKKIGIYYKFVQELEMLKEVFGDNLCTNLEEFSASNKNIALQIVSGREGISLKEADYLVFLNIDFSATSYFQAIARTQTMERLNTTIYWVFAKKGIEHKIYKTVKKKKNYTLSVFNKK